MSPSYLKQRSSDIQGWLAKAILVFLLHCGSKLGKCPRCVLTAAADPERSVCDNRSELGTVFGVLLPLFEQTDVHRTMGIVPNASAAGLTNFLKSEALTAERRCSGEGRGTHASREIKMLQSARKSLGSCGRRGEPGSHPRSAALPRLLRQIPAPALRQRLLPAPKGTSLLPARRRVYKGGKKGGKYEKREEKSAAEESETV